MPETGQQSVRWTEAACSDCPCDRNDPSIILADEPTGALDSATTQEIMNVFRELNEQGKTIIIVTHDPAVAEACSRVVQIEDGRIVEEV